MHQSAQAAKPTTTNKIGWLKHQEFISYTCRCRSPRPSDWFLTKESSWLVSSCAMSSHKVQRENISFSSEQTINSTKQELTLNYPLTLVTSKELQPTQLHQSQGLGIVQYSMLSNSSLSRNLLAVMTSSTTGSTDSSWRRNCQVTDNTDSLLWQQKVHSHDVAF